MKNISTKNQSVQTGYKQIGQVSKKCTKLTRVFSMSTRKHVGSLIIRLKHSIKKCSLVSTPYKGTYCSVSAFAPISAPTKCPWGEKCFGGYLGSDKSKWAQYDASLLALDYQGPKLNILIDQGGEDNFLHQKQLLPEEIVSRHTGFLFLWIFI